MKTPKVQYAVQSEASGIRAPEGLPQAVMQPRATRACHAVARPCRGELRFVEGVPKGRA
jgi:hypothetical protein